MNVMNGWDTISTWMGVVLTENPRGMIGKCNILRGEILIYMLF
jgi:hypothetical protein